jgi:hypothetical protein
MVKDYQADRILLTDCDLEGDGTKAEIGHMTSDDGN